LEGLFAKRKDKERRYMPLKLTAANQKKLGLTKPTDSELETALLPYLGNNLMLAYREDTLCLAENMAKAEWARLIIEEKTGYLKNLLAKHKAKDKKSYLPVLSKLTVTELKFFGLTKKSTLPELEKTLTPFLGSELLLLKKKPDTKAGKEILCLAYKLPMEVFVQEALACYPLKKAFALKTIAAEVPMSKAEFVVLFNQMLTKKQLQITKIDDKFGIAEVGLTSEHSSNDEDSFRKAFDKLDGGRIYVRICNMRRELGWNEERFNTLLRKLRRESTIQLHAGDVSTMTEEDVLLSYTDENNFFYATITWKKR
jgi:hypothetical protein